MLDIHSREAGLNPCIPHQSIITQRVWEMVECKEKSQTQAFRYIINNYHKYMKYLDTCNRRINFLVYYKGELVGAYGINSAILALGCRDSFIGWNKKTRLKHINNLANNYRFCLMREKLPTSQFLSIATKVSKIVWKRKYGDDLIMLESLVKPPFTGSVYKASNWIFVGMTKGNSFSKAPLGNWIKENTKRGELARNNPEEAIKRYAVGKKMYSVTKSEPKLVFIRPLTSDWKEVLNS